MRLNGKTLTLALIVLVLLLISGYFLYQRRKENEAAQREVIDAATNCGADVQYHLSQARQIKEKNPQLSYAQAYRTYAAALRVTCK